MGNVKPRIVIQTKDGKKIVGTQWANDSWAVHKTYLRRGKYVKGRCWTITHRPSGQAIIKHIDWRDARTIIQELSEVVRKHDGLFTCAECGCD